MKRIYLLVVFLMAVTGLKAQTDYELDFKKANDYYAQEKYDTAVIIYERIIDGGYESAPLLYNIGNAYYRLRNYPMSILNYEKALKLDPTNDEIKQNLELAKSHNTDKIDALPEFFLTRWWHGIGNMLSANGWAVMSLIFFGILLILVFFYFTARTVLVKKTTFFSSIVMTVLLLCSIVMASQKYTYLNQHNEAIIIKTTVTVKSSPSASGQDLFVLHEGSKIEIVDNSGDWDRIKTADGNIGWLPAEASIKY